MWGERRGAYRVLVRRPEGEIPPGRHKLDGRIIFKSIKKWDGGASIGLIWFSTETDFRHL
jgi:hypothetical protein